MKKGMNGYVESSDYIHAQTITDYCDNNMYRVRAPSKHETRRWGSQARNSTKNKLMMMMDNRSTSIVEVTPKAEDKR
jgi:hypothetical protein